MFARRSIVSVHLAFVMGLGAAAAARAAGAVDQSDPPRALIESFYRRYLAATSKNAASGTSKKTKLPELPFSRSFRALVDENARVCAAKAKGDICGWGADADVYLDTQDSDAKLTFENTGATVVTTAPGEVKVTLNVFPSAKVAAKGNLRTILYRLVREGDQWVVDDIVSSESSRKAMQDEIALYDKVP